jgi:hypothetical protein
VKPSNYFPGWVGAFKTAPVTISISRALRSVSRCFPSDIYGKRLSNEPDLRCVSWPAPAIAVNAADQHFTVVVDLH